MKMGIFAVYDSKALRYGAPMFIPTVGEAVRGFADVVNDAQTMISKHPSDYVLYQLGELDDSNGVLVAFAPLVNLGNAAEFKKVVPAVNAVLPEVVK